MMIPAFCRSWSGEKLVCKLAAAGIETPGSYMHFSCQQGFSGFWSRPFVVQADPSVIKPLSDDDLRHTLAELRHLKRI